MSILLINIFFILGIKRPGKIVKIIRVSGQKIIKTMKPRTIDIIQNTQKKVMKPDPIFKAPAAVVVDNAETVIKIHGPTGHELVLLKRTRVKGFCVRCIKKQNDPDYKTTLTKVTTYCPQCPGGAWICEKCFDEFH